MLLACHVEVVGKMFARKCSSSKSLWNYPVILFYFLIYVMNKTVIFQTYWNTLDAEQSYSKLLLNVRSTEGKMLFPSGNIELRRNARGTPSALSSSESYV